MFVTRRNFVKTSTAATA
ncbi:twin-arginine translocation signal domain-containing protein [Candidatus Pelagisphaera phototrophica]|nr:twin-arginine translocation signal domain-containing protein [Candidatus Pelagisphaera phototrophica]